MNAVTLQTRAPSLEETIQSFVESFDGLADLRLARAVDETGHVLAADAKLYRNHAVIGRAIIAKVTELPPQTGRFIDAHGDLEELLREVIGRSEGLLSLWTDKKGGIDTDARLSHGHSDLLHSTYDDALVALARLIETAKDMLASVIAHDLKAEAWDGKTYIDPSLMHADILRQ
jgi:hypothetical protein